MIDRQHGEIIFECDDCGDTLETGESEWVDAQAEFRREGWRAQNLSGEWLHLCADCRGRG